MYTEIFDKHQVELLPYLKKFQRTFYMVGGTAIALHLGHRRSIDFDLFTSSNLVKYRIKSMLNQIPYKQVLLFEDYVDLYFILKNHYSIQEISKEAKINFTTQFSEKLFREQLAFHKDIDYSESVEYLAPAIQEDEIKNFLIDKATDIGI